MTGVIEPRASGLGSVHAGVRARCGVKRGAASFVQQARLLGTANDAEGRALVCDPNLWGSLTRVGLVHARRMVFADV